MGLTARSSGHMDDEQRRAMERCASFVARMIEKYGEEVLAELDAEEEKRSSEAAPDSSLDCSAEHS